MSSRGIALFSGALLLSAAPALAQDTAAHNRHTALAKGAAIAIEGCVAAGQKADTFVIGAVKEIPGAIVQTGQRRVYWLDSTKHLRGHVGHHVQINGRVKDLERSEMEVELGAGEGGGAVAKIEGPGRAEVQVAPAAVGVGTSGQTKKEVDIPILLVKIDVDNVKVLRAC